MQFTEEQQAVIDARKQNLLVSAAAGSGKTAVLVERIFRLISDGDAVDIDRLLVVTFTRAAAAQMKERITQRIDEALAEDPENTHLQRQETLIHNALITTIDAFCQYVIRSHFNDVQLDPSYRVADDGEIKLMEQDVLAAFLEECYAAAEAAEKKSAAVDAGEAAGEISAAADAAGATGARAWKGSDFLYLVEYFCTGANDKALEQHILALYRFASGMPWPKEFLLQRAEDYHTPQDFAKENSAKENSAKEDFAKKDSVKEGAASGGWMADCVAQARRVLADCAATLRRALAVCTEADGPYMYAELLEEELAMTVRLSGGDGPARNSDYAAMQKGFAAMSFGRLPSKRDETVSAGKREAVKTMRGQVKDTLLSLRERYFADTPEQAEEKARLCDRAVRALCLLTIDFMERLDSAKREKNILDFSDMEHFALQILVRHMPDGTLVPTQAALEYQAFFKEILIDEYQDSNEVQELILRAIAGEGNRFMVGDVKQSIYKFRQARPEIFMEKLTTYQKDAAAAKRRIDLHKNFRSRGEVLHGVNEIFRRIMGRDLGGVAYDEDAMLRVGSEYPAAAQPRAYLPELLLVETKAAEKETVQETAREEAQRTQRGRTPAAAREEAQRTQRERTPAAAQKSENADSAQRVLSAKELEALAIAGRIRTLMRELRVSDGMGGLRALRYNDIVLLMRATSGWDETFRRVLEEEGIPVYVESRTGYFSAQEVTVLLQLLSVLDNPLQDIPLVSVMHSAIGGFTDEELAYIRASERGAAFYEAARHFAAAEASPESGREHQPIAVAKTSAESDWEHQSIAVAKTSAESDREHQATAAAATLAESDREYQSIAAAETSAESGREEDRCAEQGIAHEARQAQAAREGTHETQRPLRKKTAAFLAMLDDFRDRAVYLPTHALLQYILEQTGYFSYVTAMPGGMRRRANLEMLLEYAAAYEKTSFHGLFHFVRYMEQVMRYEVDYGEANVLDENADVVRIMSIHKSKGLEFPVVFVAGLAKRFNLRDTSGALILDADLGVGVDCVDAKRRLFSGNPRKYLIADKLKADSLGEELRVLYVALTRAKEKLIMTASVSDAEEKISAAISDDTEPLSYQARAAASGFLPLLLPCVAGRPDFDLQVVYPEDLRLQTAREVLRTDVKEARLDAAIAAAYGTPSPESDEAPKARLRFHHPPESDGTLEARLRFHYPPESDGTLEARLRFRYPHAAYGKLYTKTTVTELKEAQLAERQEGTRTLFAEEEEAEWTPAFIQNWGEERARPEARDKEGPAFDISRPVTGAARGTAYHKIMEILAGTFASPTGIAAVHGDDEQLVSEVSKSISAWLHRLVQEQRIPAIYENLVRTADIAEFLQSGLAKRMAAAAANGQLYTERQFMMGLPANTIDPALPEEELVLIQGIIDCYFVEGDEIILVDYKTDRVRSGAELIERYRIQLDYYRQALERITGKRVKEQLLYSFALAREFAV